MRGWDDIVGAFFTSLRGKGQTSMAEGSEVRLHELGIVLPTLPTPGGNMDVRELCSGATLYLPVLNPGALFSCGDAHAAQGDGEVCINGIECPADVTLRFQLHKRRPLAGPLVESAGSSERDVEADAWIVVESATDATPAARAATSRMVDLIRKLHSDTALAVNQWDGAKGRQVWYQYWETN